MSPLADVCEVTVNAAFVGLLGIEAIHEQLVPEVSGHMLPGEQGGPLEVLRDTQPGVNEVIQELGDGGQSAVRHLTPLRRGPRSDGQLVGWPSKVPSAEKDSEMNAL